MKTTLEQISYGGWTRCLRLTDGRTEAIVTTDVGPRVIRYGFVGGPNLFKEYAAQMGKRGGRDWRIFGGHRLWVAPEDLRRSYVPDNEPVEWRWRSGVLTVSLKPDPVFHLAKEMRLSFLPGGALKIEHRLANGGRRATELAPWTLSVMAPGGEAVFPQEPYRSHLEEKLPSRPLVLWPYTDMGDPRWSWRRTTFRLRQDPRRPAPQKVGFFSTRGWMAYQLGRNLFFKFHDHRTDAVYPDFGCNVETFTNDEMLELETLGPLVKLAPGRRVTHTEVWSLQRASARLSDAAIAKWADRARA